jgi:MFS family permease
LSEHDLTVPASADARRQIVLLFWYRGTRSLAAGMIAIGFPYLVLRQLHLGTLRLGIIYSAASLATAGLGLVTGFTADLWGRRKTLAAIGATLPISACFAFFAHSMPMLLAAAMIGGFSATGSLAGGGVGGAAQPIMSAAIASITRGVERTYYYSLFAFASGILAAGGMLFGHVFNTRGLFAAAAAVSAVGLLFLIPMRLPEMKGSFRRMKSARTIGQFSLTGALNGLTQGLVTPFLIPFFIVIYHVPRSHMAIYGFIAGAIGAISIMAAPALDRRLGFVHAIATTRGLGAVLALLLAFVHFFPLAILIFLVFPGLRVAAVPVQQTALTEMVGDEEAGRALGINQVTRLSSSAIAVALTGWLFSADDFFAPFLIYALVTAGNIGLYFRFFGRPESGRQRPGAAT